jgi:hypothetical protein
MLALASQAVKGRPTLRRRLLLVGIFGTAIFFGDGVITPAITVLGAIEGLGVVAPGLHRYILPVTLVVLTALFMVNVLRLVPVFTKTPPRPEKPPTPMLKPARSSVPPLRNKLLTAAGRALNRMAVPLPI